MKIWIDDVRVEPRDYVRCYSVNEAIQLIDNCRKTGEAIEVIAIDHDAGDYEKQGGDYMNVMNWLEAEGFKDMKIFILTSNSVARRTYQAIIRVNGWIELHKLP